ncbi:hypothetical protein Scep_021417 [Stephania cephalantha]|uniref:Mannose-1-phosphate guanyltransferase C-terminal domain-containing protein n=1 Tax=Stephania cephalantha TaxID=152367 RepID=A0AAP0FB22_9MAGN
MRGACIKRNSCICSSIIGWNCSVGAWARVDNLLILDEDVHIADEVYCNGHFAPQLDKKSLKCWFRLWLLELLTSRKAIEEGCHDDDHNELVAFAKKKNEENHFMEIVDSGLREAASQFHLHLGHTPPRTNVKSRSHNTEIASSRRPMRDHTHGFSAMSNRQLFHHVHQMRRLISSSTCRTPSYDVGDESPTVFERIRPSVTDTYLNKGTSDILGRKESVAKQQQINNSCASDNPFDSVDPKATIQ